MDIVRLNKKYLNFIDENKQSEIHNQLLRDIYYFYYGIKIDKSQKIIQIDNDIYNVSRNNLFLVNHLK